MNYLTFLGGCGTGALLATICLIAVIRLAIRNRAEIDKLHREANDKTLAALTERNEIGRDQVDALKTLAQSLCPHRSVTVDEDGGECNRCGAVVTFDKPAGNWK